MIEKAKASVMSVKEKVADMKSNLWDQERKEIMNEFKEKGEEKISELIEMINKYTSLFKEAGYNLNSINASLGLPPVIAVKFDYIGSIAEDKRDMLLKQVEDSKMALIIMNSLYKASDFSNSIKIGDFKLKNISITLGLIPAISISLS